MSLTLASPRQSAPITVSGGAPLMPNSMTDVMRMAEMMASAKMVPKHLQGSPGDCFMVVEQAMRWNMSPFAVAQATSSIGGKLMFEGKLVAAAVESSGAIVGFLDHEFTGEGLERTIRTWATRRGESDPREVRVRLKDAKTSNQFWEKQPDQQLIYSGSRVWARSWTPAVILGVYSREEFDEPARPQQYAGRTIEAEQPRRAELTDQPVPAPPRPRTAMEKFADKIATLPDRKACAEFLNDPDTDASFQRRAASEQEAIRDLLATRMASFLAGPQGKQDSVTAPSEETFPGDLP